MAKHYFLKNNFIKSVLTLNLIFLSSFEVFGQYTTSSPPPKKDHLLVFWDEFNGTLIDTTKWDFDTSRVNDRDYNYFLYDRDEYYKPSNCSALNGFAHFTVRKETFNGKYISWYDDSWEVIYDNGPQYVEPPESGEIPVWQTWYHSTGQITSYQRFKYGIYEVRAKFVDGSGQVPAFWLRGTHDEIDWFEAEGEYPHGFHFTIHYNDEIQHGLWIPIDELDLSSSFHTYTGTWENNNPVNDRFTIFFDNQFKWLHSYNLVQDNSMNIKIGTNVFYLGGWPIDDSKLPCNFDVDYVAVYKKYIDEDLLLTSIPYSENDPSVFVQKSIIIGSPAFSHIVITGPDPDWVKYGQFLHCYSAEGITILGEFTAELGCEIIFDNIHQISGGAWVSSESPF